MSFPYSDSYVELNSNMHFEPGSSHASVAAGVVNGVNGDANNSEIRSVEEAGSRSRCMRSCRHVRLQLWRASTQKARAPVSSLFEIVIPALLLMLVAVVRNYVPVHHDRQMLGSSNRVQLSADLPAALQELACGRDVYLNAYGPAQRMMRQQIGLASSGDSGLKGVVSPSSIPNLTDDEKQSDLDPLMLLFISYIRTALLTLISRSGSNYILCSGYTWVDLKSFTNASSLTGNGLLHWFPAESDMENYILQDGYSVSGSIHTLHSGVVFEWNPEDVAQGRISYSMRMNSTDVPFFSFSLQDLQNAYAPQGWSSDLYFQYMHSHTLLLQYFVASFFIHYTNLAPGGAKMLNLTSILPLSPNYYLEPFPIPAQNRDDFATYFDVILGLLFLLAFLYPVSRYVRSIVYDRESKVTETMKVMGATESASLIAWTIVYAVQIAISVGLCTAVMHHNVLPKTDPYLLFLMILLFAFSLLGLGSAIAAVFSRARLAGLIAPLVLFVLWVPFFATYGSNHSDSEKGTGCLLSPTCFAIGAYSLIHMDGVSAGAQWSDLPVQMFNFKLETMVIMLFFDIFIYGGLAWYLGRVWPTEYGGQWPFYFLCLPSYWADLCGCTRSRSALSALHGVSVSLADAEFDEPAVSGPSVEIVPKELRSETAIRIRGLNKTYPASMVGTALHAVGMRCVSEEAVCAVKSVDLDVHRGEIVVLLGENGAGKTSTLAMLTGLLKPSGGRLTVLDHDIRDASQLAALRRHVGYCPQTDILFDHFKVEEQLAFYFKVKAIVAPSKEETKAAVDRALDDVQLQSKRSERVNTLSGGQKRRLSLAVALIGQPRVLFLDEAGSAVDAYSRRALWGALQRAKLRGTTIVLTTHDLAEAEAIGDRIAILAAGVIAACGSPLFLKRFYRLAYKLTVRLMPGQSPRAVIDTCARHFPPAAADGAAGKAADENVSHVLTLVEDELCIALPLHRSDAFPALLADLEKEPAVQNTSLAAPSMEDVFLASSKPAAYFAGQANAPEVLSNASSAPFAHSIAVNGESSLDPLKQPLSPSNSLSESDESLSASASVLSQNVARKRNWCLQFSALFHRRIRVAARDRRFMCCQLFIPLLIIALGLGMLRIPPSYVFPRLDLTVAPGLNEPLRVPLSNTIPPLAMQVLTNAASASGGEIITETVQSSSDSTFQLWLLNHRSDYAESRYGAYFASTQTGPLTIVTNFTEVHGLPLFANFLYSSLMARVSDGGNGALMGAVQPFPWTQAQRGQIQTVNGIFAAVIIAFAFSFLPAAIGTPLVREKELGVRRLQFISGANFFATHGANYCFDLLAFCIPLGFAILVINEMQLPNLTGENLGPCALVLALYGLAVVPFTYFITVFFKSHSAAQSSLIFGAIAFGNFLSLICFALHEVPNTAQFNDQYLRPLFRAISPNFALGDGIFYLSIRDQLSPRVGAWDLDVVGMDCIVLGVQSIAFLVLALLLEWIVNEAAFVRKIITAISACIIGSVKSADSTGTSDPGVISERRRLEAELESVSAPASAVGSDTLVLRGVSKQYRRKAPAALNDVWLGVRRGECVGYLGENGSGKTTTLKIITGELNRTVGAAVLRTEDGKWHDCRSKAVRANGAMGYVPQVDALNDLLTGREHLQLFAAFRGLRGETAQRRIDALIHSCMLTKCADRLAGTYSGGNKRKLSLAIAMIGAPPLLLLDEMSTGTDPAARNTIANFIAKLLRHNEHAVGQSHSESPADSYAPAVLLTSHNLSECELLCDRIAMLVDGNMVAMGSLHDLRLRHARHFDVSVQLLSASQIPTHAAASAPPIYSSASDEKSQADVGAQSVSANSSAVDWIDSLLRQRFPQVTRVSASGEALSMDNSNAMQLHMRYRLPKSKSPAAVSDEGKAAGDPDHAAGGVADGDWRLSEIFSALESARAECCGAFEYSVTDLSLEQLFIAFAQQRQRHDQQANP